jgi:hypothetical protein
VQARVSTDLSIPADLAWATVKRPDTFAYITRGVLGVRPLDDDIPEVFEQGFVVRVRLWFFHVLPAWKHEIEVVRLDDATRELYTNERGGPVRGWNHLIKVEAVGSRSRYTDSIDIEAGPLTPIVWLYAQLFYRYRQHRWRKLARRLRAPQPASGNT